MHSICRPSDSSKVIRVSPTADNVVSGTIGVLLHLIEQQHLTLAAADALLAQMRQAGYRAPVSVVGNGRIQDQAVVTCHVCIACYWLGTGHEMVGHNKRMRVLVGQRIDTASQLDHFLGLCPIGQPSLHLLARRLPCQQE